VSMSETFLALKERVAPMFKTQAQEIVFLFRGDLSIFVRDDLTLGSFQLILGTFRPFSIEMAFSLAHACPQEKVDLF
jgi:hypothetical protein